MTKDLHQEALGSSVLSSHHSICILGFKQVPWANLAELLFMTGLVEGRPLREWVSEGSPARVIAGQTPRKCKDRRCRLVKKNQKTGFAFMSACLWVK